MKLKTKIAEWAGRYLPAEALSMVATLLSAWLVHRQGGGAVVVALVSTWSGNIGYFGYIVTADVYRSVKAHHKNHKKYNAASAAINLRSLIVEFGLAEILDSLLIRPVIMYYIPSLISDFTTGIIVAKLTADVFFYIPAILGYEMNKKVFKGRA